MKYLPIVHLLLTALGHSGFAAFIKARVCSSESKRSLLYPKPPKSPKEDNVEAAKSQKMKVEKNKDPCRRLTWVPGSEVSSQPKQLHPAPPLSCTDTSAQTKVVKILAFLKFF